MKYTNEQSALDLLDQMCTESLDPEYFGLWQRVEAALIKTRGITVNSKHQEALDAGGTYEETLSTLKGFNGTDFKATGDDIVPLHGRGTIVDFRLGDMMPPIPAFIHARHQFSGGWKYDLNIAVKLDDAYHITRLYNIEEKWLHKQS